jgi:hypothetical protein
LENYADHASKLVPDSIVTIVTVAVARLRIDVPALLGFLQITQCDIALDARGVRVAGGRQTVARACTNE